MFGWSSEEYFLNCDNLVVVIDTNITMIAIEFEAEFSIHEGA